MSNQVHTISDDAGPSPICRNYTPSMLAELLGIDIRTIRAWIRRGLLVPIEEIHRLAYFDYQGVLTARQLAKWRSEGASAKAIEADLSRHQDRRVLSGGSLAALSLILRNGRLYARDDVGLVDPRGQRCFDFETFDGRDPQATDENLHASTQALAAEDDLWSPGRLLAAATTCEEEADFEGAIDHYRALLFRGGPNAEANFALAELLYRVGDLSAARERYACALEIDEHYVEARANLGCVFAELGQLELAVAAFRGTLAHYGDYADAHYHLAQLLDKLGEEDEALSHWRRFLELTPESPWADTARVRLGELE